MSLEWEWILLDWLEKPKPHQGSKIFIHSLSDVATFDLASRSWLKRGNKFSGKMVQMRQRENFFHDLIFINFAVHSTLGTRRKTAEAQVEQGKKWKLFTSCSWVDVWHHYEFLVASDSSTFFAQFANNSLSLTPTLRGTRARREEARESTQKLRVSKKM